MRAKISAVGSDWAMRFASKIITEKPGLVALTLHNIPADCNDWLIQALSHIKHKYGFIDPLELFSNKNEAADSRVLLTFDDGFASNKWVAESVLAPLSIKAVFFATYGFIGLSPIDAYTFAQRNFYPARSISEIDGDVQAMGWDDLKWLINQGHELGAHTYQHRRLTSLTSLEKYREIIDATEQLELKVGRSIKYFAYPFGSVDSIDEDAIEIASKRFDCAFSNVRGMIDESPSRHFLYRQNVTPGIPMWKLDAIVQGQLDWRYRSAREEACARFSEPCVEE